MALDIRQCYEILDLQENATSDEAKRAYRQLIKQWHPDLHINDQGKRVVCEEKSRMITEAYRQLEPLLRLGTSSGRAFVWPQDRPSKPTPIGKLEPVRVNFRWGYADSMGRVFIPAVYETAAEFCEGLAAVSTEDGFGYIDESGAVKISLRFSYADQFVEGRALVQFGKYGYINRVGDWVVKPRFQAGTRFQEGVAAVRMEGKWGYIKANGDWFVLPRFEEARPFENGRAYAILNGRPVVLGRNGQVC
ncbi:MAG: WG repeat-containing protein [Acidobacteria bacterium]|nr:WG repeat-containing protein [Acidobacteriota bacterium]